jgi:hypothetical protein
VHHVVSSQRLHIGESGTSVVQVVVSHVVTDVTGEDARDQGLYVYVGEWMGMGGGGVCLWLSVCVNR